MPHTDDGIRYRVIHQRPVKDSSPAEKARGVEEVLDEFGGSTIVHIMDDDGEILAVGRADVHPKEQFNRKLGKTIALGRALKSFRTPRDIGEQTVGWWEVETDDLDGLMVLAFREAERAGLCYVHFGNQKATFVLMTPERYEQLAERIFPNGVPVDDDEWIHAHVEPVMLEEVSSLRIRREASRRREPSPTLPADVTPKSDFGI